MIHCILWRKKDPYNNSVYLIIVQIKSLPKELSDPTKLLNAQNQNERKERRRKSRVAKIYKFREAQNSPQAQTLQVEIEEQLVLIAANDAEECWKLLLLLPNY